ncbi:MAG TPA: sigma-70 family RNA polymerase sigma factor [Puia sp.]|nr:sigma-70 family RNA polymerase sigma factor [Puia sp.]
MEKLKNCPGSQLQTQEFIAGMRKEESRWFELLYQQYWDKLILQAYTFTRNRSVAEEIVQELFIRLFTKGIRFRVKISLGAYLQKALRNSMLNHLRDQALYRARTSEAGIQSTYGSNTAIGSLDLIDTEKKFRHCLSQMPGNCRTVFVMNREQGLTVRQIAKQLMRSEHTAEKQLRRAVSFLRERLDKHLN